jgi:hypothetical protein
MGIRNQMRGGEESVLLRKSQNKTMSKKQTNIGDSFVLL